MGYNSRFTISDLCCFAVSSDNKVFEAALLLLFLSEQDGAHLLPPRPLRLFLRHKGRVFVFLVDMAGFCSSLGFSADKSPMVNSCLLRSCVTLVNVSVRSMSGSTLSILYVMSLNRKSFSLHARATLDREEADSSTCSTMSSSRSRHDGAAGSMVPATSSVPSRERETANSSRQKYTLFL